MKTKAKVVIVTVVMVAVAAMMLYAPLTNALQAGEEQEPYMEVYNDENLDACCRRRPRPKARWVWWFLNHSEPVELEGTAVTLFKNMLVVEVDGGQIRIHLPQAWIVNGELMTREELFESGYLSAGENLTIKALRADLIDKEGLSFYLLLGYEIIDSSEVSAYAVLPFNIDA